MGFELVRKPRTRLVTQVVRKELTQAYKSEFFPAVVRKYRKVAELDKWDNKPKFVLRMKLSTRLITVYIALAGNNEGSKIFKWVDFGTSNEGDPGTTYPIDAVNAPFLVFEVPYQPITYPPDGLNYDPSAPKHIVKTVHVDHPGIKPRRFSEEVIKWAVNRRSSGGFFRVTENAYARAWRKIKRAK